MNQLFTALLLCVYGRELFGGKKKSRTAMSVNRAGAKKNVVLVTAIGLCLEKAILLSGKEKPIYGTPRVGKKKVTKSL